MLVQLFKTWFVSTETINKYPYVDKLTNERKYVKQLSGARFRPGIHEMPDEWKNLLPKSARILEDGYKAPDAVTVEETLRAHDLTRAASDSLRNKVEEAQNTLQKKEQSLAAKERRRAILAKARAKKAELKAQAEAEAEQAKEAE